MQFTRVQLRRSISFLGLALLLLSPLPLLAVDPHDTLFEDVFDDGPKFIGSDLQKQAADLVALMQEREQLIRKGIESNQLAYDGDVLRTKPGATEEMVEGLGSLNNRIELLGRAQKLFRELTHYSSGHPEDKTEIEKLKSSLHKAVEEFQDLEVLKSQIANLDLKQLEASAKHDLLDISKHEFNLSDISISYSKPIERFIQNLRGHLEKLKGLTNLSSSDEKIKADLFEAIASRLATLEDYQSIQRKNEQLGQSIAPYIAKKTLDDAKPALKRIADTLSKWTGNDFLAAQIKEAVKKTDQFIKGTSTKPDTNKESPKITSSPVPKSNQDSVDLLNNEINKVEDLRSKKTETENLINEIERKLKSNQDLGINLELEYRHNLEKLTDYQNSLDAQIKEAKKSIFNSSNILPKIQNSQPINESSALESFPGINKEPTPDSKPGSSADSTPPNNSPSSQGSTTGPSQSVKNISDNTPKNTSNSNNTGAAQNSTPSGSNSLSGLPNPINSTASTDDKATTRVSSLDDSGTSDHKSQFGATSLPDTKPYSEKFGKVESKAKVSSEEGGRATDSKTKASRQVASNVSNSQVSQENQDKNPMGAENILNGAAMAGTSGMATNPSALRVNPRKGSSSLETPSLLSTSDKADNAKNETISDDNARSKLNQEGSSEDNFTDSDPSFSLRKQPKRDAKNRGSQQKRIQNPDNNTPSYASNSPNYPITSYQNESKPSLNKNETAYLQNPDGTSSKDPRNSDNLNGGNRKFSALDRSGNPDSGKSTFQDLEQISIEIKSGDMNSQLDLQVTQDSDKSIWQKFGIKSPLDSVGKILAELYPLGDVQKPSDITNLLTNEKAKKGIRATASRYPGLDLQTAIKPKPTSDMLESKPAPSLLNTVLAWLGFN